MKVKEIVVHRLVKSEDLNHHGTLYAGRCAEWFVEAGFIAAADLISSSENLVCAKIHGMTFKRPVHGGDTIKIESKVIWTERSKIVPYVKVSLKNGEFVVDGFLTFVHVDEKGHSLPHGLSQIEPETEEDKRIFALAQQLT
ncbi:MAG: acyl-CoA thioesterase [Peptococcia bacterium]|jgi:acyl-CoA hydrolase